ncbi:MAG: hypothetical protein WKF51_13255 [Geodermatophilaceae bacterium]
MIVGGRSRRVLGVLTLLAGIAGCSAADPALQAPSSTSPSSTTVPTVAAPPPVPTAAPDRCARSTLAGMDLAHRVGQLMMVGVPVNDPIGGYAQLMTQAVGNVFLAGRSSAGAEVIGAAVATLQIQGLNATGAFLQIAADQEGGLVQTLTGPGFSAIPTALEQGRLSPDQLAAPPPRGAGAFGGAN